MELHVDQENPEDRQAYEQRLRRRLYVLKEELEHGRFRFPGDSLLAKELQAVRLGPDGQIDLSTVGPSVRSTALAVEYMAAHREAKSVNLSWVQTEYFAFLEDLLGDYFKAMSALQATPGDMAHTARNHKDMRAQVLASLDVVGKWIGEFWEAAGFIVDAHLRDMRGSLGLFGGDIGPQPGGSAVTNAALLVDTVVIPDPIDRVVNDLRHALTEDEIVYLLVKHGLSLLQIKRLFFAETPEPVAVVMPGFVVKRDEFEHTMLFELASEDALFHLNSASGAMFESLKEAEEFLDRYERDGSLESRLVDPSRVIADLEWKGSLTDRMRQLVEFRNRKTAVQLPTSAGSLIVSDAFGRMSQANALLRQCNRQRAIPVLDAPTSWRWMKWKYEYDSARGLGAVNSLGDIVSTNALTLGTEKGARGFSRLSADGLIALRESGGVNELRAALRDGISDLLAQEGVSHEAVMEKVVGNLDRCIREYDIEVARAVEQQHKFIRETLPLGLGGTAMFLAGPITGNYALTVLAAAAESVGATPTLKHLWDEGKRLVKKGAALARTPIGLLVEASK